MKKIKNAKFIIKLIIIIVSIILLVIIGLIIHTILSNNEPISAGDNGYYIENYDNNDYYIIKNDYSGEYDIQYTYMMDIDDTDSFEVSTTMNYSDYSNYCKKWNIEKKYTNKNWNYIVFSYASNGSASIDVRLAGVEYNNSDATLYIWDDASGTVATVAAYVLIIPTEEDITNIKIQNTYELNEYENIIGKSPIGKESYDYEENKIIAQNAYIYTNNDEINRIFNKMLDSIVEKHSIEISDDTGTQEIIDFISSSSVFKSYNDKNGYIAFGETYSKEYTPSGGIYEFRYDNSRDKMLYHIALTYEWDIVLGLSDTEKNPYYDEKYPLVDTTGYTCNVEEDDKYYILTFNTLKDGTDTYYINKNTYLIEKLSYEHGTRKKIYYYSYSDYVVTIPDEVFKNSYEEVSLDKPIIYLYPTKDTEVSVKLLKDENITCSYPKYKDEWKVLAQSNGTLKDLNTNRELYSLYYESKRDKEFKIEKEGFVVKSEETISFLEEKLAILGLTEREAEEFIVYWLPKLESNKYNYIRFATIDEINENMPLEINPTPDTIIRVLMTYKGLENPIIVKEQKLTPQKRTGFVAAEWGGTEIK